MRVLGHIAVCAAGIFLLLILPFLFTDGAKRMINGVDAVSSASVIIDRPSGNYTVLINREKHSESDLSAWHDFFSGGDFEIIFDDIDCVTLAGDAGALTMAQSFMSRLPENQMKVRSEDPVLSVSKARYGKFDMMILSDEAADSYGAYTIYNSIESVDVIHIEGAEQ